MESRKETSKKGNTFYYNEHGDLHRTDGPAFEGVDGGKEWYLNGQHHRTDGPAVEWANGDKEWFLNGKKYSEEEFKKEIEKRGLNKPRTYNDILKQYGMCSEGKDM